MLPVFLSIAEIDEIFVPTVGAFHAPLVLDGTKMLLGPGSNLSEVSENSVRVGAIFAIQLLNEIEIGQAVAIEREIVAPMNLWYAIDRKTNRLIDGTDYVRENDGNQTHPNHRRREKDEKA